MENDSGVLDSIFRFVEENLDFYGAIQRYFYLLAKYPDSSETVALGHYLACFVPDSYTESVVPKVLNRKLISNTLENVKRAYGPLSFELTAFSALIQCNHAQILEWALITYEFEDDLGKIAGMILRCADKQFNANDFESVCKLFDKDSKEYKALRAFFDAGMTYEQALNAQEDIESKFAKLADQKYAINYYVKCFGE